MNARLLILLALFLYGSITLWSQQPAFNVVLSRDKNYGDESYWGTITDIKQDPWGYIWLSTAFKGLQRYDGMHLISYVNDPQDSNSISNNRIPCLRIDSSGIIWAATYGGGLDKFDPIRNKFVHFRHNANDPTSLANDTVFGVLRDHMGMLWVGTYGGLDRLNEKTGRFTHYKNIPGDATSLSYNRVWYLYEDRQGVLWVGCGSPFLTMGEKPDEGGLNRFDRKTGTFTRYIHDPADSSSIGNNKVRAIFEDSKGNFWIGTAQNGLNILDRETGKFQHYYYDAAHPEKLSPPPSNFHELFFVDHITFISEDQQGSIWIGASVNGVNKYDASTKTITHFDHSCFRSFLGADGLMWLSTAEGDLYTINPSRATIPYYPVKQPVNALYYDEGNNMLWIGGKGLIRKDLNTQSSKTWIHDPLRNNSLCNDTITGIKGDRNGYLWIATVNGLCKFDPQSELFTTYRHNDKDARSISGNRLFSLFIDHHNDIWTSSGNWIVEKLDPETGVFTHYAYNTNPNNLINDYALSFGEDKDNDMWLGTRGALRLDQRKGAFYHYAGTSVITSICIDASGIVWVGGDEGLFRYSRENDRFLPFNDPITGSAIRVIKGLMEDNGRNLWIVTNDALLKLNSRRDELKIYKENFGVHSNTLLRSDACSGEKGQLFLSDQAGYYAFNSSQLKNDSGAPTINFTEFKIGDREINNETAGILNEPILNVKEIDLDHDQNTFSIGFFAIDYKDRGEKKYLFMLQNYDDHWHSSGGDAKAYLFKIPPGKYLFRVKAVNAEGNWSEKSISIIISPPWWQTWWAYAIFVFLFGAALWGFIHYRSRRLRRENRLLEQKVEVRTHQLQEEKQNVETALSELKSTQSQLIQSEKMASLGELTAGIAHEIQNPLNFVNNFSEVNNELIEELKAGRLTLNAKEHDEILNGIFQNNEKISFHGKRADAIVKGMLQHSRTSSGQKELTDINALCDEYVRLAYHGLLAKDKSFNAGFKTDFDPSLPRLNVVPQDIGRVLLNLINNAFYAVSQKLKAQSSKPEAQSDNYEPSVTVSTKKVGDKVLISVRDNGNGIHQKVLDKIFQPFFTTKPTGQGTGLGLSLAYDIVKAHGGEIELKTEEGKGSEFVVQLNV